MKRYSQKSLLFGALLTLLVLANLYLLSELSPVIGKLFAVIRVVVFPFFIAMIISYVLNPVVSLLSSRMVPRTAAVILIYATFLVGSLVIFMNVTPLLGAQIREISENLPVWNERVQVWLHSLMDGKSALPLSVQEGIDGSLDKVEAALSGIVETIFTKITGTISQFFIWLLIPFVIFYMLKDFQAIERSLVLFLPKQNRRKWLRLLRDIDEALGNYIRGQLLVCVAVGVLAYIGYMLIGLPYALLLASVVALMNIIPYLGPFIGAAPAILVGLSVSWQMALLVVIVNVCVQVVEGSVFSPQIVGRTLRLHPLVIILALILGGEIGGVLGLLLAVPAVAVIKVVLEHLIVYRFRS